MKQEKKNVRDVLPSSYPNRTSSPGWACWKPSSPCLSNRRTIHPVGSCTIKTKSGCCPVKIILAPFKNRSCTINTCFNRSCTIKKKNRSLTINRSCTIVLPRNFHARASWRWAPDGSTGVEGRVRLTELDRFDWDNVAGVACKKKGQ